MKSLRRRPHNHRLLPVVSEVRRYDPISVRIGPNERLRKGAKRPQKKGQLLVIYRDTMATFGDHLEQHSDSSEKTPLVGDNNGSGKPPRVLSGGYRLDPV